MPLNTDRFNGAQPDEQTPERVVIAMSGGVDSSVAAALLKREGREVIGIGMHLWNYEEDRLAFDSCCSPYDVLDARAVAGRLGIPYYLQNYEESFREEVVGYFIDEYQAGRTPNPCVACNQRFKFSHLLRRAKELGADQVATGHYARLKWLPEEGRPGLGGRFGLFRGKDPVKDQSYFLFSLNQSQLERALFPVGDLTKEEVRELARELGLKTAEKPESQEICFVAGGNHGRFIEEQTGVASAPGPIVDRAGRVLGQHRGLTHYTVGQRKGLGVSAKSPLYVLKLDGARNQVVVGGKVDLERSVCTVRGVNWIAPPGEESGGTRAWVQIRHHHTPQPAQLLPLAEGRVRVEFEAPERGVAPGQAAVFYREDEILGGGWIE